MKICIIGANGMLGWNFYRRLSREKDIKLSTLTRCNYPELSKNFALEDFLNTDELNAYFFKNDFDWILNCAGAIKQRNNVTNRELIAVNALFPQILKDIITNKKTQLLHFSTDCVFSGCKGDYSDDEFHDATDFYGRSKSLGEISGINCLTLRTSIIGHGMQPNSSLVDWFLSNAGQVVSGYTNAIYNGLPAAYIADIFVNKIKDQKEIHGIYNLSSEKISKYSLLDLINHEYKLNTKIESYSDFKIDRSLNSNKLRKIIDWEPPSWKELVKFMQQDYFDWKDI